MKYLFLLLLLVSPPALAQRGHTYWEADPDSLLRVAARQTADTARLRTLEHALQLGLKYDQMMKALTSITALAKQLHQPEYAAYRQMVAGQQLIIAATFLRDSLNKSLLRLPLAAQRGEARNTQLNRLALDSIKGSLRKFDALGSDQPPLLLALRYLFRNLHQPEEERVYLEAQLAFTGSRARP